MVKISLKTHLLLSMYVLFLIVLIGFRLVHVNIPNYSMTHARTCIKDILILLGTKQNISSSSVYTEANDKRPPVDLLLNLFSNSNTVSDA